MNFGKALEHLKCGDIVSRSGWNGKGMWLSLTPGRTVYADNLWSKANRKFAFKQPAHEAEVLPYITMKTADNKIVPWLASQTDILAEDWDIVIL